ncbi:hypothetical protein F4827_003690 [Paraburkholderia bannensis]|uniref:Uncharacterized protein n=1 Tax=Paraburkholderia bannensis TaxID=765414 RepID=A0A7W9U0T5_9BURK|nr:MULTISPECIES: hypothetical protein [Paraburkholderia]MBB3258821.1 hypothetical protein [Paraburkholderia sp. WP4_3_2]MBB6103835.1 hypothetical protein [Paraburkholderia bannensis]
MREFAPARLSDLEPRRKVRFFFAAFSPLFRRFFAAFSPLFRREFLS